MKKLILLASFFAAHLLCMESNEAAPLLQAVSNENPLKNLLEKSIKGKSVDTVHSLISDLIHQNDITTNTSNKEALLQAAYALAKKELKESATPSQLALAQRFGQGFLSLLLGSYTVYKYAIDPLINGNIDSIIQNPTPAATGASLISFGLHQLYLGLSNADMKEKLVQARAIKENISKAKHKIKAPQEETKKEIVA